MTQMSSGSESDPKTWIGCDETAADMFARVAVQRPPVLIPPLHRVPLRPGNVIEIVGPSPSAKSEILIQAAISCILPSDWNGVHLGGTGRLVVYFDLDCRFNVLRLAHCLKHRLAEALDHGTRECYNWQDEGVHYNRELFQSCMRRFLYIRCYSSLEFLAALKTMPSQIEKECEGQGVGVYCLMIDSINAFYWMDRAFQPPTSVHNIRKSLSLQSIMEAVVREIRNFLQVYRVIVFATKSTILGADVSSDYAQRTFDRHDNPVNSSISGKETETFSYREYMPSVWQVFVTHRMCIRVPEEEKFDGNMKPPIYTAEWILPPLNLLDRFAVTDVGITLI